MRESVMLQTGSVAGTRELGAKLGRALIKTSSIQPIIIALSGELGAGKTTLVGGLLQSLGYSGTVKSPTYTLIETYEVAGRAFHHVDLYRLNAPGELENLGFDELLQADAIVLIEWAERAAAVLPAADLAIGIQYVETSETARAFLFKPGSELGKELTHSAFS